jgi:uncharacterized lipoprotein YajG
MKKCLVIGILLAAELIGCALSPQTVAIKPLLNAQSYSIGRGRSLALEVLDQRPTVHFGSRGGVYRTALITPRTDVAQAIRQALAERLSANGFKVVLPPPTSVTPLSMRVDIQRIEYIARGDPIVNEVHIKAAIRASTRNGDKILTSQYQANKVRRVLTPPDEVENEIMINEIVAEALQHLLQDKAVLDLLSQ